MKHPTPTGKHGFLDPLERAELCARLEQTAEVDAVRSRATQAERLAAEISAAQIAARKPKKLRKPNKIRLMFVSPIAPSRDETHSGDQLPMSPLEWLAAMGTSEEVVIDAKYAETAVDLLTLDDFERYYPDGKHLRRLATGWAPYTDGHQRDRRGMSLDRYIDQQRPQPRYRPDQRNAFKLDCVNARNCLNAFAAKAPKAGSLRALLPPGSIDLHAIATGEGIGLPPEFFDAVRPWLQLTLLQGQLSRNAVRDAAATATADDDAATRRATDLTAKAPAAFEWLLNYCRPLSDWAITRSREYDAKLALERQHRFAREARDSLKGKTKNQ